MPSLNLAVLCLTWGAATANFFGPSIFCVTVVDPGQVDLYASQFLEGIGVLACDAHMVLSSIPAEEMFKTSIRSLPRWPVNGPNVDVLVHSQDESSLIQVVSEVWQRIHADGRYADFDWTVKMDLSTAFHPERLRDALHDHCSEPDCDAIALLMGNLIPGPVQALTKAAVAKLAKHQLATVCNEIVDSATAEATCLQRGLNKSGVKFLEEKKLLINFQSSNSMPLCTLGHGAFWPFPAWADYMSCMGQAGYAATPDGISNPSQISWTRDVLQTGYYLRPTFFCWVLVKDAGEETDLLKWQRQRGLGLFACDGWMVISNASAREVLHGEAWHTNITTIHGIVEAPRTFTTKLGKVMSETADAGILAKAWQAVFKDNSFRQYDWVVKLDINVVVVPERFRHALHALCDPADCGKKVVHNFGGDLLGAVQAFSAKAASTLAAGVQNCMAPAGWDSQPEYRWMSSCASTLSISAARSSILLSAGHKVMPRPCDSVHGSFAPFPETPTYALCLKQSGYYYIVPPETTTRTSTTTSTTRTTTSFTKTSSTVSTTTSTFTIPKVAPNSIFSWEGRDFQKKLPIWVLTAENEQRGIPFAIQLGCALLVALGVPLCSCIYFCRSAATPAQTAAVQPPLQEPPAGTPGPGAGAASEDPLLA